MITSPPLAGTRYAPPTDRILLTVPSGPRGSGVVSLVLGGLGARLDLPVDRVDELTLAATTVARSPLAESLELEVEVHEDRLLLRVGPLESGTSADPGRRLIIERLVDGVATHSRDGHEWVELELLRRVAG